ncbi:MAG: GAF domain-containing protein [Vicinamibacterales bacterium]
MEFVLQNDEQSATATLKRLRAIQAITDSTLVTLTVDELLKELLARLRQTLRCGNALVYLPDPEAPHQLLVRAWDGLVVDSIRDLRVPVGAGLSGRVFATHQPVIVEDMRTLDYSGIAGVDLPAILASWQSAMGVPLRVADRVIGVVAVTSKQPRQFTQDDLGLIMLVAERVAPVIERRRLVDQMRRANDRLKRLSRRLLHAQEEGRRRIAVELHDELGQVLTATKIHIDFAARLCSDSAAEHLAQAAECIERAVSQVRDLSLQLRPSVLDDLGLAAALRWHVDRFTRRDGLSTHLAITPVSKLAPEIEITCFRVAQEALTNVSRHSGAANVWVELSIADGDRLRLAVRDDGAGFDVLAARGRAARGLSLGLLGMEERAELIDGILSITSAAGQGTEVRIEVPMTTPGTER